MRFVISRFLFFLDGFLVVVEFVLFLLFNLLYLKYQVNTL